MDAGLLNLRSEFNNPVFYFVNLLFESRNAIIYRLKDLNYCPSSSKDRARLSYVSGPHGRNSMSESGQTRGSLKRE